MSSSSAVQEAVSDANHAEDRFGRVEVHGIDYIPVGERHGRARELFMVWASSNTTYLNILLGGGLVVAGLNTWQALAVVVAGNAFWALVGFVAVTGPVSGTPSSVTARSMFGIRGNRVNAALIGWDTCVAYEAINLAVGSLAAFALVKELGAQPSTPVKLLIVIVTAGITLAISVYGHATIVRMSGLFTVLLVTCMAVLAVFVVGHADLGYTPPRALSGSALWVAVFGGLTIIASAPLGWGISADYARYLPPSTSPRAVAAWTAIGGFLPCTLLGGLGVLAGTAVDMTDPQTSLKEILPSWFYPVFLAVIAVSSLTSNVLTMYSSGLSLQAMGIKARRSFTVAFDGLLGVALTIYALFISDFLDTLDNILQFTVIVLGPNIAIYAADIVLRRNRYDGMDLHNESPGGPFWFTRGFNLAGIGAQIIGTVVGLLCVNTTLMVGPVAAALGGTDLSAVVSPLVGALVYTVLTLAAHGRSRTGRATTSTAAFRPSP
ncbi:purine-cytosine permease family protein [Microtetraspora malaysiensis]|uniref:purine-cytosine permease family protein n=1 Tax=Microtetraspora malaysiensis TaxID=161358 RepID=UPI003D90B052